MRESLAATLAACVFVAATAAAAPVCNTTTTSGLYNEYAHITYGADPASDLLNLFIPTRRQLAALGLSEAGAILLIHGRGPGYDNVGRSAICEHFASNGIACASVEYNQQSMYKSYASVNCALRWLRANGAKYLYASDRIGVYGTSAGASIASFETATQQMTKTPSGESVIEAGCPNADKPAGVDAAVLQYGGAAGLEYMNTLVPQFVSVGDYDNVISPEATGHWVQRLIGLGAPLRWIDPGNKALCGVGAVCGGPFSGTYQYWDLGGQGHGYQVFGSRTSGPPPKRIPVPANYSCAVLDFYWNALLHRSAPSMEPLTTGDQSLTAGLVQ